MLDTLALYRKLIKTTSSVPCRLNPSVSSAAPQSYRENIFAMRLSTGMHASSIQIKLIYQKSWKKSYEKPKMCMEGLNFSTHIPAGCRSTLSLMCY